MKKLACVLLTVLLLLANSGYALSAGQIVETNYFYITLPIGWTFYESQHTTGVSSFIISNDGVWNFMLQETDWKISLDGNENAVFQTMRYTASAYDPNVKTSDTDFKYIWTNGIPSAYSAYNVYDSYTQANQILLQCMALSDRYALQLVSASSVAKAENIESALELFKNIRAK